jgi:hypothetical protein
VTSSEDFSVFPAFNSSPISISLLSSSKEPTDKMVDKTPVLDWRSERLILLESWPVRIKPVMVKALETTKSLSRCRGVKGKLPIWTGRHEKLRAHALWVEVRVRQNKLDLATWTGLM